MFDQQNRIYCATQEATGKTVKAMTMKTMKATTMKTKKDMKATGKTIKATVKTKKAKSQDYERHESDEEYIGLA